MKKSPYIDRLTIEISFQEKTNTLFALFGNEVPSKLSKRNISSYQMVNLLVFLSVVFLPLHFASQRRCPEVDVHWFVEIVIRLPPLLGQVCWRQNELSEMILVLDTSTRTQARKQTPTVCGWIIVNECHQYLVTMHQY